MIIALKQGRGCEIPLCEGETEDPCREGRGPCMQNGSRSAAAGLTRLNLVPSYRDGKKSFMRVTVETMPETTTGINHGCAESLLAAGSACQHG